MGRGDTDGDADTDTGACLPVEGRGREAGFVFSDTPHMRFAGVAAALWGGVEVGGIESRDQVVHRSEEWMGATKWVSPSTDTDGETKDSSRRGYSASRPRYHS